MKIGIFTTFSGDSDAYSLNSVVIDQMAMLKSGGYDFKVLTAHDFESGKHYDGIEVVRMPEVTVSNDGKFENDPIGEIHTMYGALREALEDVDICITHDIIYQNACLIHNAAFRMIVGERPDLKWLHWIHSATANKRDTGWPYFDDLVSAPLENSIVCYPNSYEKPRVAINNNISENIIRHVPHPIDICSYHGFHQITRSLVREHKLLGVDIIMVYPARLDRGKQLQANIRIIAALKREDRSVRLIIPDFHSTGGDKLLYRQDLKDLAEFEGLEPHEVIFMSEFTRETEYECPREVVRDLFLLSNVFVLPSVSETYSLVAQEAAICGNLLVLNFDFPAMRSIYGDDPIYLKFSSNVDAMTGLDGDTISVYENERNYFAGAAKLILARLMKNDIIMMKDKLRKTRNLQYVFNNYLEPLLYED